MATGWNNTLLNIGNAAMQGVAVFAQLYTAAPDATGTTNTTTAGRQAVTWVTAANGQMVMSGTPNFTGGAASGPCTQVGFWSASTGGTFYGYFALTGDQTFNAAGQYTLTGFTDTATSS